MSNFTTWSIDDIELMIETVAKVCGWAYEGMTINESLEVGFIVGDKRVFAHIRDWQTASESYLAAMIVNGVHTTIACYREYEGEDDD